MFPWGVQVSLIEAGAHRTKLLSGDVLAEQWQAEWDELSDELKQEYGQEGLHKGNLIIRQLTKQFSTSRAWSIQQIQSNGSLPSVALFCRNK